MKKLFLIVFLFLCGKLFSQSQDLKQLQLNIQKLAQLKAMLSETTRGYAVLEKGYSSIKNLEQGNFSMHKSHLDQLLDVSSNVKNSPKIRSIGDLQSRIVQSCRASEKQIIQSAVFSADEKTSINSLLRSVSARSGSLMEELQLVSKPGVLRMNDAERMQAIDRIETLMKQKLVLVETQAKNIATLITSRQHQLSETKQLKSLY